MTTIEDRNGRLVPVRRSRGRGRVLTFERRQDNVLLGEVEPPDALIRQVRGYVANRSRFAPADAVPDDQIVLRRDALRATPESADSNVQLAVLGVSEVVPDLSRWAESEALRPVAVRWLTWDDLAACPEHPRAGEFARYIAWKRA